MRNRPWFPWLAPLRRARARFDSQRFESLSAWQFWGLYLFHALGHTWREFDRDNGPGRSAGLAFTTILGLVPFFTVIFAIFKGLGAFADSETRVIRFLTELLPVQGGTILTYIHQYVQNTAGGAVSGIGTVFLVTVAVSVMLEVDRAINDFWKVTHQRPYITRVLIFYALLTLTPLLLVASLYQSARINFSLKDFSLLTKALPYLTSWLAFFLAYKLVPHTRVRWRAALGASIAAAICFELIKRGFNLYVDAFLIKSYTRIYGALGVIPVFLGWVYLFWMVVLLGAKLGYVLQNLVSLQALENERQAWRRKGGEITVLTPATALALYGPVARAFASGEGPIGLSRILVESGCPRVAGQEGLTRLEQAGLLSAGESRDGRLVYAPARPLEQIPLEDILDAFREDRTPGDPADPAADLAAQWTRARGQALAGRTAADLIPH